MKVLSHHKISIRYSIYNLSVICTLDSVIFDDTLRPMNMKEVNKVIVKGALTSLGVIKKGIAHSNQNRLLSLLAKSQG